MTSTFRAGLLAFALFASANALVARTVPHAAAANSSAQKKAVMQKKEVTPAEVAALHKQLETISSKLSMMLNAKDGSLAHAKVGPSMQVFLKELQTVLSSTADKKLAPALAMEKLMAAKEGLASLMGDLTARQESIMKEDNAQRESLLLGVLMTNQKESMAKQIEILQDSDFAELEVAKALLKEHNATTPLYVQAATYLDKHPKRKAAPMTISEKSANPLAKIQSMLEKRLASLVHEYDVREKFHQKKVADFAAQLKTADTKEKHTVHILAKREERNFKKWSAMRKHDIDAMKGAVEGVKKGDMKAVQRARTALENSMKALQSQTGGFLYLIQLGHKLVSRDCPYCAAQCVDKCHTAGKPYVQCLTDCADAGKGQ
jgi:hypothetical protein